MSFQTLLGNFALILLILTVVTGAIWFYDTFVLAKRRRAAADAALAELDAKHQRLQAEGLKTENVNRAEVEAEFLKQPTWVEYTGSFFPVIALVFFLRSFLYEPFKIPSTSMLPTLYVGDLILVNKFTYGIRLPVIDKKIIDVNQPQRGDVMVFRYPADPSINYIKRVVGVPGDKVVYKAKRLSINGTELSYQKLDDFLSEGLKYSSQFNEKLGNVTHRILNDDYVPSYVSGADEFPFKNQCRYTEDGFECTVPQGQYFMLGDNRDNSRDSRYWGFVPEENIVGKAIFIWMNLGDLKRIGSFN